jgi:hypothetical protein
MQLFIKNTSQYDATYTAVSITVVKDNSGTEVEVVTHLFTKVFSSFTKDPTTGIVQRTGYTSISEEEFEALSGSCKLFRKALQSGRLVRFKDAPADALLDSQIIDKLVAENAELKKQLAEARQLLATGKDATDEQVERPTRKSKKEA